MSDYSGGGFVEWVEDSVVYDMKTPQDRVNGATALLGPYRAMIDSALEEFEPEEMCWRDFRNNLWDRIPKIVSDLVRPILRGETLAPTPLRVYVCGGGDERHAIVKPLIDALGAAAIQVTHDWTGSDGYERRWTDDERAAGALADIFKGVRPANLVWYAAPVAKSEGSHGEIVAALLLAKPVIVSGPYRAHNRIFPFVFSERDRFDDHEDAFAAILKLARP